MLSRLLFFCRHSVASQQVAPKIQGYVKLKKKMMLFFTRTSLSQEMADTGLVLFSSRKKSDPSIISLHSYSKKESSQ